MERGLHMQLRKEGEVRMGFKILLILAAFGMGSVSDVSASQGGGNGIGIILGQPSGLVAKFFTNKTQAIDLGLAYSMGGYFQAYVDELFHFFGAFSGSNKSMNPLTPYLGIGAVFSSYAPSSGYIYYNSPGLGVRVPLGLEWRFGRPDIGVFAEIAPGLTVIPATYGFVMGGVGIRFYF